MTNDFDNNTNIQMHGSNNGSYTGFGRVLASDNGQRFSELFASVAGILIVIGLALWFLNVHLSSAISRDSIGNTFSAYGISGSTPFIAAHDREVAANASFVFWGCVVLEGGVVVMTLWIFFTMMSSNITICEGGIYGKSLDKTLVHTNNIQLFYDQISSVDSNRNSVAVSASGTKYRFIVTKPAEVMRMIIEQQRITANKARG